MERQPDFNNILKVLRREAPDRPTLFEFYLNLPLYEKLVGRKYVGTSKADSENFIIQAFRCAGYDYATVSGSAFILNTRQAKHLNTRSLNEGGAVPDREAFDAYEWPSPDDFDYSYLDDLQVPDGMKLMVSGPCGVLENAVDMAGYENLCVKIYDDPQFVEDLFDKIGSSILRHYEKAMQHKHVGLIMSNDDWGFNTQTMLSVKHMREYVFPWHKKIVELAHSAGLPVVLHSCGYANEIMDDIIDDIGYDGKHSFEDSIMTIEDSYRKWGGRIALLGGIDLNFLIHKSPAEIRARSAAMLELGQKGFALGTGNSVPEFVPDESYFAMTSAALS